MKHPTLNTTINGDIFELLVKDARSNNVSRSAQAALIIEAYYMLSDKIRKNILLSSTVERRRHIGKYSEKILNDLKTLSD